MLKKLLRRILPNSFAHALKRIILLKSSVRYYTYDARRFLRYSTTMDIPADFENLEATIIAHCHVIEKGMVLKETELGYGKEVVESLLRLLDRYMSENYPTSNISFIAAVSSLQEYVRFHEKNNYDVVDLKSRINEFSIPENCALGGTTELKRDEILRYAKMDFNGFSQNRFSIRNFTGDPVDLSLLKKAIRIAQKTPSVCNRQSSRVYIIQDEKLKNAVLACQKGHRGFGHLADKILIITSDLRSFCGIHERNQPFIDAGMFGMSLLYGLHYVGLGACALNWSVEKDIDRKLKKAEEVGDSEVIVFMIAVGNIPEMVKVAKSARKKLDEIIFIR